MDDEIAWLERRDFGDELVEIGALLGRARKAIAEDVLLGEERRIVEDIAVLDGEDGDPDAPARRGLELAPARGRAQIGDAVLMQHGAQAIGRAGAIGGDQHAPPGLRLAREMIAHGIEQIDLRVGARLGKVRPRACAGIDGERRSLGRGERTELADAAANKRPAPFLLVEKGLLGPHRAIDRRGAAAPGAHRLPPRLVEIGNGGDALVAHILGLVVEHESGIGQVVENRLQRLVVERQPMLHADVAPAGADRHRAGSRKSTPASRSRAAANAPCRCSAGRR